MNTATEDRAFWVKTLDRVARPVLHALADRKLHATMPCETAPSSTLDRRNVTHLEALGRTIAGIASWLELGPGNDVEGGQRGEVASLARAAIGAGTDPASPDFCNFTAGGQPLVDSAFLAHGLLRAPKQLWEPLDGPTKSNVIAALKSSRVLKPGMNNWLLFSAMVEAALCQFTGDWNPDPVNLAFTRHMQWYKGDGVYGDGPWFHWDYYNSFVIQPMLIDVLETVQKKDVRWNDLRKPILHRARRYAHIQESLISPEGTFPAIGRSLAYRFGALQLLGQMALRRDLPGDISPGQVRCAMSAVIRRMIDAPGTFDKRGWLTIGFAGHQPNLGERYISTGSLYLCTVGLLPLGLPPTDEFWTCDPAAWSSRRAWGGKDVSADHSLANPAS